MMTFSEKLVVLRKIKHLTQDEFASAVGVSRQAVYKWESGQSYPEVQKLIEMKMLFAISIDDLLDDTFEIELPKKKRRKRKPKAENAAEAIAPEAVAAPVAEVVEEIPAPVVEEPVEEPVVEAVAEPVIEEPAVVEEPVAEEPTVEVAAEEPVAEPVAKEATEEAPKFKFKDITVDAPAPKEINDPTDAFAKRGGLFGRIFGKK